MESISLGWGARKRPIKRPIFRDLAFQNGIKVPFWYPKNDEKVALAPLFLHEIWGLLMAGGVP
jgi:hypothetical protein